MNWFFSQYWQQRDVEQMIGKWLRIGVFISAIVALLGGVLYLQQVHEIPDYKTFHGAAQQFRHLPGILHGAAILDGASIIQLAVVLLIATPILRIAFSVLAFAIEKDKLYVIITLIVLSIIIFGMYSGLGG
jgi:uncharacterized membrane protein